MPVRPRIVRSSRKSERGKKFELERKKSVFAFLLRRLFFLLPFSSFISRRSFRKALSLHLTFHLVLVSKGSRGRDERGHAPRERGRGAAGERKFEKGKQRLMAKTEPSFEPAAAAATRRFNLLTVSSPSSFPRTKTKKQSHRTRPPAPRPRRPSSPSAPPPGASRGPAQSSTRRAPSPPPGRGSRRLWP